MIAIPNDLVLLWLNLDVVVCISCIHFWYENFFDFFMLVLKEVTDFDDLIFLSMLFQIFCLWKWYRLLL